MQLVEFLLRAYLFFPSGGASYSCYVYYDAVGGILYIYNEAANGWMNGTPGSSGTVQNSQCSIAMSGTTIVSSGNNRTMTLPMTFADGFAGVRPMYMNLVGTSAGSSGWRSMGTFTVAPVTISISPASLTMNPSSNNPFTATVANAGGNNAVTWTKVSGPGALSSPYAVYTSPNVVTSNQTVTIQATSVADPTKSATATITVTPWTAGTPYHYYVTDPMTAIGGNYWGLNGSAAASASGLTAGASGGSAISRVAVADGSSDYEVQATVHLISTAAGTEYSVLARASADGAYGYKFAMVNPIWDSLGCAAQFFLSKTTPGGGTTVLAQLPYPCHDGMKLRIVARGSAIAVGIDTGWTMTFTDAEISSGAGGVYVNPAAGSGISNVQVGAIDTVAPNAVGAITSSASPSRVDLQWAATSDDTAGSGVAGYRVWRDGVFLGTTATPGFTDDSAAAGQAVAYSVAAFDWHGNVAAGTAKALTVPATLAEGRRIGVRGTGAYWGGAGEQIDVRSGNLNFSLPVVSPKSRGGWGATFRLSYNSQNWRQDSGTGWNLGTDSGVGYGWRILAGSVTPIYFNGNLQYFIFADATGAEYRLDQVAADGTWYTKEGPRMWLDWGAQTLHFPDGSWWQLGCTSAALEGDAGTFYPTQMMDTNGNSLTMTYQAGAGSTTNNTSSRIVNIYDARTSPYALTYPFAQHMAQIVGDNEGGTMSYTNATLTSPFGGPGVSSVLLSSFTLWNGTAYQFTYNSYGELTQVVTPLGGVLGWSYSASQYSGTRQYREVTSRTLQTGAGGTAYTWNLSRDTGVAAHTTGTVSDVGAGSSKVWGFGASGASAGLATSYEERGGATALMHTDYSWTADSYGNLYVDTVTNTLSPGANQVRTKSTQSLDAYGNVSQSAVYDYGLTLARTYNYTYLTDANYTSRYIRNRLTQATMTVGVATTQLVTNTYDGYGSVCAGALGIVSRTGTTRHDDTNYGTGLVYRGNVTYRSSIGGTSCMGYEMTGVVVRAEDAAGHFMNSALSADTSYSLPGTLTPQGNANLATSVTYDGSWAVTSVTGPNGAQGTTTYDQFGRPQKTKIPDGAETNYTYAYAGVAGATANQQTATLGARFKRTTLDGFGRVTRVESGHDATTVSQVDTQYAPCGCSPLMKLRRVSMPYAPGGTPVWAATYGYDGSGRTLTVTAADGSVTRYTYIANQTTVTDPAGKWKLSVTDGLGNLTQVQEPNPAGGANLITNYTYDTMGHLTDVSMPRSTGTQTRHFVYTGSDMTSATNPENGTVTYVYDASHRVTKRTDTMGQETRYTYDGIGRLLQVQHWVGAPLAERTLERVDYTYDSNPLNGSYSQNAQGRLAAVTFKDHGLPVNYQYNYNVAGRVTAQHMEYDYNLTPPAHVFDAAYTWDTEGRMTGTNYGPSYQMQYDVNGRLSGMTDAANGNTAVASATYGMAGEMLGLDYFGYNETRSYNSLLQMTHQTVSGMMDMQYNYTAGANNGRITSAIDGIANETVSYTYDSLNRLSSATAGTWGQGFGYDGFGNLTSKTATLGSVPVLSVSFDPATNRQVGQSYDANGNLMTTLYDVFDVENRMITQGNQGTSYAYDHAGKRIRKSYYPATDEYYFYGINGQKLATQTCTPTGCPITYNVYFGGKLLKSKSVVVVTDRLGSVRAPGMSYYPYGEERTPTADNREKFGTYTRDSTTQDYADQRYYAPGSGRFMSPDPYQASGGPADPSSWNRYAYTRGDPVNRIDPMGLADFSVTGYCYGCSDSTGPSNVSSNADRSVWGSGNGNDMAMPEIGDGEGAPGPGAGDQTPSCDDLLRTSISGFLADHNSQLLTQDQNFISEVMTEAEAVGVDPRLFIAETAESGWGTSNVATTMNNPFGLKSRKGNTSFDSVGLAVVAEGNTLNKFVNTYGFTVSQMYSGLGGVTDTRGWEWVRPPAYCQGSGCQNLGRVISDALKAMGGDPDKLKYPSGQVGSTKCK